MPKKTLQGTVVSNKMTKTVVVKVARRFTHEMYNKVMESHKKYHAHSELQYEVGDVVTIEETKPLSKMKRWRVIEQVKQDKKVKTISN